MITYKCPKCCYQIHEITFLHARYEFLCPRCNKIKISFFNRIDHNPDPVIKITKEDTKTK